MKNTGIIFLSMMVFLFFTTISNAQKTGIQVIFDVEPNCTVLALFEEEIEYIKKEIETSLISNFNETIGFLDFKKEGADHILRVTLKSKAIDDSGFLEEYWLSFVIENSAGTALKHHWQFLDLNESDASTASAETLVNKFKGDWEVYVKESYNQDFVANLFDEIAVTSPDKIHYHELTNLKEAILPFDLKYLKIDPDHSEFRALANCNIGGVDSSCPIEGARYSGVVNGDMQVPDDYKECIRIRLDGTNLSELSNGKIFITSYRYKFYPGSGIRTTNDFIGTTTD